MPGLTDVEAPCHTCGGARLSKNRALIASAGRRFYELSDTQDLHAAGGVHPNTLGARVAVQIIAAAIQEHKEKRL